MTDMKKLKFPFLGLPRRFVDETLEKTTLAKARYKHFNDVMFKAPQEGVLLVSGTCGPVVNHLYEQGRDITGVNFVEYYEATFTENGRGSLPKSDVLVVYSVGAEPAKSKDFGTKLLGLIMEHAKNNNQLLVLETHLSKRDFEVSYGISIVNHYKLELKKEQIWV